MTVTSLFLLSILGMITGLFAGLFGIGGGAILVPALAAFFLCQQFEPQILVHMALATSMSCIVFNALFSIYAHQKHQAIIWPITFRISPAVLVGSALATYFVLQISGELIAIIFFVLMFIIALHMLVGFGPSNKSSCSIKSQELIIVGFLIGAISSMIAIGGGSLTVPYLTWHQINIRNAIATAASIGLPIALASCFIFILQNNTQSKLPDHTLGFIYWPATLAITLGSVLTTKIGANLTHKLPIPIMKKLFAVLIILLALKMYLSIK